MSFTPGTALGPYEILAPIGKGGMGEVYRARDTRLDRDVAIKVSTVEFSERFSREARSIAALNHSNVCHLYDVGPNYLVLEYVEGENLAGPMSFDEALPIVRQLIDGIEAAHEKNIIHRDLKTANIRITPEGVVKILDFGLAKAAEPESSGDPANSPTFAMGATQAGMIVGTAAYMSPEQAKGKSADRRSDIWGFGVVVYELLVGRTPFEGESAVEILGAVINKEPDWSRVPPRAQRLLRWCLEKDRRKRLSAIGDARMLLEESVESVQPVADQAKRRRLVWPATAAALFLLASALAFGWWSATRPVARPLTRLSVDLGPDAVRGLRVTTVISLIAQSGSYGVPRLSPDGRQLAYTAAGNKGIDVWVYDLGRETATQLTFTNPGLREIAWAPDSKHLVFGDGKGLFWIRADGSSQPQRLLESADSPRPFSFRQDGRLVYSPSPRSLPDLWTLPVDLSDPERPKPGKPEPFLTDPRIVEVDPAFSPDGKFLAYASTESGPNEVYVQPFPSTGGKWKVSTAGGKFPAWSRATRELFFLGGDDRIMVVNYTIDGNSFISGTPRAWSPTQVFRDGVRQNFDVSPDGKRVVMFPRPMEKTEGSVHATFLLNFFDEVRRRVP